MTETARALNAARQACIDGRPDDPIEISAVALIQLAHMVTQQQGVIESLMLDIEALNRRLNGTTDRRHRDGA